MNSDFKAMFEAGNLQSLMETYLIPWSLNIVLAILIFIVGRIVVKALVSLFKRMFSKSDHDPMMINFLASILRIILLAFVIIAALDQLGVQTTSMVAILGAAGLAIGLSLQGSLKNFAAGVLLLVLRPFTAGDYVEAAGIAGTVNKITVFNTVLTTPDNREIIVPNGQIYEGNIINYSANSTRRVDMVFGVSYDCDLLKAKAVFNALIEAEPRILDNPAPTVAVSELADSSVNFVVRPWVNATDYWSVRFDFIEAAKLRLDEEGIGIPFPQMDVHVANPEKDA